MTALFELPLPSETLATDELAEITGAQTNRGQAEWLAASGWRYHTNRAGRPIVGRMYARTATGYLAKEFPQNHIATNQQLSRLRVGRTVGIPPGLTDAHHFI